MYIGATGCIGDDHDVLNNNSKVYCSELLDINIVTSNANTFNVKQNHTWKLMHEEISDNKI